jgi:hypothetical protein
LLPDFKFMNQQFKKLLKCIKHLSGRSVFSSYPI